MSTIFSKPSTYNFAGNIADLGIYTQAAVAFKLWRADQVVLNETYTPSANRVMIPLKDYAEIAVQPSEVTDGACVNVALTPYRYEVDGSKSDPFYIVPGGVGVKVLDAALFLKTNFLTWQPQTRHTTTSTPQWLRYVAVVGGSLEVRGYFADGTSRTVTHSPVVANCIHTFNVNYGYLISLFGAQPTYADVWIKSAAGEALSYTQRYILTADDDPDSDYFVFANSLGGYDAIRFYGQSKDIAKPEGKTVTSRGKSSEHNVDGRQARQKYTGFVAGDQYTPREQMRQWVMEFFGSSDKYVLERGELRRIVVTGSKIEDVRGELSGYEFTYEIGDGSRYLNIPRAELPERIEVIDPGGEVFFLKPRLENFPRANLDEEVFLPAQQAYGNKWSTLALSEVLAYLREFVIQVGAGGGGGGGVDIEALKKIFHMLGGRSDVDFVARMLGARSVDAAERVTTKESIFTNSLHTVDFLSGLLGYGMMCDAQGNMEADSLILRKFLQTPELVKNQIRVISPEVWFTENGVADHVIENPTFHFGLTNEAGQLLTSQYNNCFYVTFRNQDTEAQFDVDDILRGIYNYDDGFETAFLRVRSRVGEGWLLEKINGCNPMENMVLARQGNYTNPARQGAVYVDSAKAYIRVLGGMNSTEIKRDNLMAQLGNLRGLAEMGITDLPPVGLYTRAGVFKGLTPSDVGADPSGTSEALKKLLGGLAYKNGLTAGEVGADPAGTAASALTALEEALGGLAYKDAVELAQLGSTIIDGAYIKTGLIDVVAIAANVAFIQKLVAQTAFIEKLVARRVDTRVNTAPFGKRGFVFEPGLDNMKFYDSLGNLVGSLSASEDQPGGVQGALFFNHLGNKMSLSPIALTFGSKTKYGADGVEFNTNTKFNSGTLQLPPSAVVDMPCVALVGYDVIYDGSVNHRFGAKAHPQMNATYLGNGKYQIYHNIGHAQYNAIPVVTGGDDNSTNIAREISTLRTTTSCVIRITNLSNEGVKVPFTVTIFGKN